MRTPTEAATPLRVIELAGAPGAGKTTLLPAVADACDAVGLRPYTVTEAARPFARRTALGRFADVLPFTSGRRLLWAIFYWASMLGGLRLAWRHPRLVLDVVRSQRGRPADADAGRRRVVYWFFRMAGAHLFLRRHGRAGEVLILDEGYVHRTVQLHSSAVERPDPARIQAYVAALPRTDLVVVVRAPVDACQDRVRHRGVWRRLGHRSPAEIDRFVANAHEAVTLATAAVRATGRPVLEVDNAGCLADTEVTLKAAVREVLGSGRRGTGPWRTPWLRVPRIGRLRALRKAHLRRRAADPEAWTGVLRAYGLTPTGGVTDIAMGRRNRNVIVATSDGQVVVRRYRSIVPADSVAHEHEVLTELERHGFPAVRLRRTSQGRTVVHEDQHLYAVFDYERGRNLASWILLDRRTRARLQEVAGRTLARMHDVLGPFRPDTAHHLGFSTASGDRPRDLAWFLDALDELPSRVPSGTSEAVDHHRALGDLASDIADQIVELDRAVSRAKLPRTVIHGDFGVHNLIVRPDGSAVVTDFELARRELRLIDLVIVLSRTPRSDAEAFLSAYLQDTPVPADEWHELTNVWRYYRLTGAVQSWSNHFVHGGVERLRTARARVAEAEWAQTEVVRRWG
jgi:Ser/Thr protein kinase RdoA (MazF antagonist)